MSSLVDSIGIHSKIRDYCAEIYSDTAFFDTLAELQGSALLVDKKVYELYPELFEKRFAPEKIFVFEAVEENKTLEYATRIYQWLIYSFSAKRNLNFISVGGGITLDVSGWVASTLYRGINWYYVPTTLLAQIDSCIGSKTSLNFGLYKNLLGTFYPPHRVFIYPGFYKTLSELDRCSGFGEVIKFLLMEGLEKGEIQHIPGRMTKIAANDQDLTKVISDCLNIKRSYMENDEFDRGRRNLLNFGHCFGHALESASDYYVPHGIAVNIGIAFSAVVAAQRQAVSWETAEYIFSKICKPYIMQHQRSSDYCENVLLDNLKNDKKRTGNGLPMVYPAAKGLVKVQDLTQEEFLQALKVLKEWLFGM